MTTEEWDGLSLLIENAWGGEFDDTKAAAYRFFLGDYSEAVVMGALRRLVQSGQRFLPSAAEIAKAAGDLTRDEVPSWPEAWAWIGKAITRGARVGGGWSAKERAAMAFLEAHGQTAVEAFVAVEDYRSLATTEFFDPDYGALRLKELEKRWREFVGKAEARLERGLALEPARRRQLGPAKLQLPAAE